MSKQRRHFLRNYRRNFLVYEFCLSLIPALLVYIWWEERFLSILTLQIRTTAYATVASLAGTLLGFMIATISIVMLTAESQKLELLRESPHYKTLYKVFFSTVSWLALLTGWSMIGLLLDQNVEPALWLVFPMFWLVTLCVMRIGRSLYFLRTIIFTSLIKSD